MYLFIKTIFTALIVVGISEMGRKFSLLGAFLASLPLTSILAMIWIYQDTKDTVKMIELSYDIFFLVIPSLLFFLFLPWFLKLGLRFYPSLVLSIALMAPVYFVYLLVLKKMGVKL